MRRVLPRSGPRNGWRSPCCCTPGSAAAILCAWDRSTCRHRPDGPELFVEQEKTGNKLLLPVRPGLQAVLDVWPAKHLTFLTTKTGKPYGGNDFSDQFRDWCDAAGLPKACTAHGLRHAAGRLMAERSCTVHEIAAVLGHKSLRMAEHYRRPLSRRSWRGPPHGACAQTTNATVANL